MAPVRWTARPRCAVPECRGISHADATFREALWDRFFTAAPSERLYSDRRLDSLNGDILAVSYEHRPSNPRKLVGQRYGHDVAVCSRKQSLNPPAERRTLPDPRSGSGLRRCRQEPIARHGHPREHVEANGWGNEQVHGSDVRCVVTQEGAPSLGRRPASLDHVLLYGPAVRCKPDVRIWR
jgi:hypothetical protein